jgi:hypothetical protein
MSTPDDVWEWIRPPLEELKQGYTADPDMPWEERRQTFLRELELSDASQHPVVEQLLQRLDESPEEERNRILGSDELNSMAYQLAQEHGAGQEAAGGEAGYDEAAPYDEAAGYDEQAWQAYLAENGPQWDGTEDSWEQFRQWFGYYAGERGLSTPATAFLDYLTPQPAADRIATFAQYGVMITPPQAAGDGAGYDEQAWQAYLAENGPQWDGTEDSWEQFREWFAYYAGERGLSTPATALLDYLTPQPAADRIATFAQYGVAITAPEQAAWADEAAPAPAEEEPAAQEPAAQAQAGPGPGEQGEPGQQPGQEPQRPDLSPEQIKTIMDQVVAQDEEFEKISPERRRELMDQVLGGR